MKIKKIILHNFRAFRDEEIPLNGNFTCIIGKNDIGKSTILAALDWFFSDKEVGKFDINIDCFDNNELYVEIIFSDIIIYEDNNLVSNCQFDVNRNDNKQYSFKCDTDFLKKVNIRVRKNNGNRYIISIFNELGKGDVDCYTSYYQINDMFQKLYDSYSIGNCNITIKNKRQLEKIEFDTMIKNCGLKISQFKCFSPSHPLKDYLNLLFRVRFYHNDFDKNISGIKSNISSDINTKVQTNYPNMECYFDTFMSHIDFFPLDDLMFELNDSPLKNIPLSNRGEGFQWEVKNAVCRLLAESISGDNDNYYIFAFEEPETHLHPSAQIEMYETIKKLSENTNYQVFITTHSPYIVKQLAKDNINPIVVKRDENLKVSKISKLEERVLPYISMNEINYIAFDEPSIEYHIELFGFIQQKTKKNPGGVDSWLLENKYAKREYDYYQVDANSQLIPDKKGGFQHSDKTLPYCVRNQIDHPNDINKQYENRDYIRSSIDIMRNAILNNPDIFQKKE